MNLTDQLLKLAIEAAKNQLREKFPNIPVALLLDYAPVLVELSAKLLNKFSDPIQTELEFRALYALIEEKMKELGVK